MENFDLVSKLKDPSLFVERAFVDGEWMATGSGATFDVLDPATGRRIASVPDLDADDLEKAIHAASHAQKFWAKLTGKQRASTLRRFHDLVVENVDDLAIILTAEMGKPLQEARGEILYGAAYIEWFAEEAKRLNGDVIPAHQADKRILVIKRPVGVVGAITP